MKILIYLVAIAVIVGGVVMFLGGGPTTVAPEELSEDLAVGEDAEFFDEEFLDEEVSATEEEEPFPPAKLYNFHGFIDCGYFWDDVSEACPAVKQTQWASNEEWDINAGPFVCKMQALGIEKGEFRVGVSRAEDKSAASAGKAFNEGRAGYGTIGFKTVDVPGLGDKAYTVVNPIIEESGFNFTVSKGSWIVDITSSNPSFCATEAQTRDVVQRVLRKLP